MSSWFQFLKLIEGNTFSLSNAPCDSHLYRLLTLTLRHSPFVDRLLYWCRSPHPSPCGTTFSASRITGELCRNRIGPQPKETRQSPLPTHLIITRSVPPLTVRLCVVRVCCREKSRCENANARKTRWRKWLQVMSHRALPRWILAITAEPSLNACLSLPS